MLAKDLRPDKPVHRQFTSKMWTLTKKCWNKDPKKRPSVSEVLRNLESREGGFSIIHADYFLLLRNHTENNRYMPLRALSSRINLRFGEREDTNHQG